MGISVWGQRGPLAFSAFIYRRSFFAVLVWRPLCVAHVPPTFRPCALHMTQSPFSCCSRAAPSSLMCVAQEPLVRGARDAHERHAGGIAAPDRNRRARLRFRGAGPNCFFVGSRPSAFCRWARTCIAKCEYVRPIVCMCAYVISRVQLHGADRIPPVLFHSHLQHMFIAMRSHQSTCLISQR